MENQEHIDQGSLDLSPNPSENRTLAQVIPFVDAETLAFRRAATERVREAGIFHLSDYGSSDMEG